MMRNVLVIVAIVLSILTSEAFAATPVLNFSDITSGPNYGLVDAAVSNQGAIVTIWGNNLGDVQGTSKVFVGGVETPHVYYWGKADRTSGPADLSSYHRMQEISFAIPASVPSGLSNITVSVGGVSSNSLPFTVRQGNIYFVSSTGVNTNSGSWSAPWRTVATAVTKMVAGDILYLRGGSYEGFIIGGKVGTEANPFAVIAYPSERVTLTPYSSNTKYVVSNNISTPSEYWHFSKLRTEVQYMGFGYLFKGERIIANEITNQAGFCAGEGLAGVSGAISSGGGGQTADGILMLGNYIHDYGCDPTTMPGHDTSSLQHTYYVSNRTGTPKAAYEIGWSLTKDSKAPSGLHNYDQGVCGGWTGELKIHDNVVVNQRGGGINWDSNCNSNAPLTATVKIYNNLLINTGLGPIAYDPSTKAAALNGSPIRIQGNSTGDQSTIYLENNTVIGWSDSASDTYGMIPPGLTYPANAGAALTMNNNLLVSTMNRPFYDGGGKTPLQSSNNLWYANGATNLLTPSWDVASVTSDPKLDPSYAPGADSPVVAAGVPSYSERRDLRNQLRGSSPAIGALEYAAATPSATPVVSIAQPLSGTSITGNSTVTVNATDLAVSRVELYVDGSLRATGYSVPYSYLLDSTTLSNGNHTLLAKGYDAQGTSASSSIVLFTVANDTQAPSVVSFALPASSTSLTVPITSLSASDNVAVTGYLVSESSATPLASDARWQAAAPSSITFAGEGSRTAYAWAKDTAGNVSLAKTAGVVITLPDTAAPVVSIAAPTAQSTLSSTATVTVSATDNVGVTRVELYANGVLLGTDGSAPYTFTWNTLTATNGSYSLTTKAYDAAGNVGTSAPVTVNVFNDTLAPSVTGFAMPTTFNSTTVAVTSYLASDNVGVTGYLITESATAPSASATGWKATAPTSFTFSGTGQRTAYAWAKDAAGNVSASSSALVLIDTTLPVIKSISLLRSTSTVTIKASAVDNMGVTKLQLYIDGALKAEVATGSLSYTWTVSYQGYHLATVKAYDAAGNVRSQTVSFYK